MLMTLFGMVTLVRLVQSANAVTPMLATLSGIVTLSFSRHGIMEKALLPMLDNRQVC